jgi:aerobic carbon-monoxide dehydrogenase large subunit
MGPRLGEHCRDCRRRTSADAGIAARRRTAARRDRHLRTKRQYGGLFVCNALCSVAVDPETGAIELLDFAVAADCGTMINPMLVEGQICGGVVQGIGTALYEEIRYDPHGQPLAATFLDYHIPGAHELPTIRIGHLHTKATATEYGTKGMGEGGAVIPPAAIANAVRDALAPLGVEINETPLTPERVLTAIRRQRR